MMPPVAMLPRMKKTTKITAAAAAMPISHSQLLFQKAWSVSLLGPV